MSEELYLKRRECKLAEGRAMACCSHFGSVMNTSQYSSLNI